jgi:hypothetical protein
MTDYLSDGDGDLLIQNGDFVKGTSDEAHMRMLLTTEKGMLRQWPTTGVGIRTFLQDDNLGELYQEIQKQFEADRITVEKIKILEDGKVELIANY